MKFTVVINCLPSHETATHALMFCKKLLATQNEIAGVMLVERGSVILNSEFVDSWRCLAQQGGFPIHCCVNAAHANNIKEDDITAPFHLSGLGQLAALNAISDRVITFGER